MIVKNIYSQTNYKVQLRTIKFFCLFNFYRFVCVFYCFLACAQVCNICFTDEVTATVYGTCDDHPNGIALNVLYQNLN